jgi:hypothetical protein
VRGDHGLVIRWPDLHGKPGELVITGTSCMSTHRHSCAASARWPAVDTRERSGRSYATWPSSTHANYPNGRPWAGWDGSKRTPAPWPTCCRHRPACWQRLITHRCASSPSVKVRRQHRCIRVAASKAGTPRCSRCAVKTRSCCSPCWWGSAPRYSGSPNSRAAVFATTATAPTARRRRPRSPPQSSIWGNGADPTEAPDRAFVQKWNATGNAFEALLSAHNDGLLVLDEIHTCDTKDFGAVIYNMSGGKGRQALDRERQLRRSRRWQDPRETARELHTRGFLVTRENGHLTENVRSAPAGNACMWSVHLSWNSTLNRRGQATGLGTNGATGAERRLPPRMAHDHLCRTSGARRNCQRGDAAIRRHPRPKCPVAPRESCNARLATARQVDRLRTREGVATGNHMTDELRRVYEHAGALDRYFEGQTPVPLSHHRAKGRYAAVALPAVLEGSRQRDNERLNDQL